MKVQVSRGGVTVRAREMFDVRTYEDRDWAARLGSALDAPIPATSIGLRVTSYLAADPDDAARLKLRDRRRSLAAPAGRGDVPAGGARHGRTEGPVRRPAARRRDRDASCRSRRACPLAPGSYIVRAGRDGRRRACRLGRSSRRSARRSRSARSRAAGPVLVRVPTAPTASRASRSTACSRTNGWRWKSGSKGTSGQAAVPDVVFEIAATADGPALVSMPAALSRGSRDSSMIAQAVTDMRVLPPGPYFARATVRSGGESLGEVRRAFTVIGAVAGACCRSTPSSPAPIVGRAVRPRP